MLKVNIIDYKTKDAILAYLFAPVIANKSRTARNIRVFKDLNIIQLGLAKDDSGFNKILYI